MKVSVVIPLYNKVRHIARAVESVRRQTWQDFELIVVDDGSTDRSGEVVRKMADSRIRLVVQPNAGECAARNRGIQEAGSELVAFLDADDEWLPCFLETVMDLGRGHPDAGIYATAYCLCEATNTFRPAFLHCVAAPDGGLLEDYFRAAIGQSPVWSSACMIPKSVLQEVGGFPVGIRRGGDLATWAQIALRYHIAWSPVSGAIYHLSADNRACQTQAVPDDLPGASKIEEFLRAGHRPVSPHSTITDYLVFMRLAFAQCHCLAGRKRLAFDLFRKTRGTVVFARKRQLLFCLLCLPSALLRPALKLRAMLRASPKSGIIR
jgi:glycosyltransferase involved in cell wall biosynthesis